MREGETLHGLSQLLDFWNLSECERASELVLGMCVRERASAQRMQGRAGAWSVRDGASRVYTKES